LQKIVELLSQLWSATGADTSLNDERANRPERPTFSSDSRAATSNPQEVQHQPENPVHPTDHGPSMGLHGDTAVTREILQVLTKDELKDLMKTCELTSAKKNCTKDALLVSILQAPRDQQPSKQDVDDVLCSRKAKKAATRTASKT